MVFAFAEASRKPRERTLQKIQERMLISFPILEAIGFGHHRTLRVPNKRKVKDALNGLFHVVHRRVVGERGFTNGLCVCRDFDHCRLSS